MRETVRIGLAVGTHGTGSPVEASTVGFAVPSPQGIGPLEADKVARTTLVLDARLELLRCIFACVDIPM
jgi:hypothetical protein